MHTPSIIESFPILVLVQLKLIFLILYFTNFIICDYRTLGTKLKESRIEFSLYVYEYKLSKELTSKQSVCEI